MPSSVEERILVFIYLSIHVRVMVCARLWINSVFLLNKRRRSWFLLFCVFRIVREERLSRLLCQLPCNFADRQAVIVLCVSGKANHDGLERELRNRFLHELYGKG